MLVGYPTISTEETLQAKSASMLTLAGLAIDSAVRKLYSSPLSLCVDGVSAKQHMLCLYLYLYAADTWCNDECVLTETEYIAIVGKLEQLQQECCDYKLESNGVSLAISEIPNTGGNSGGTTTPSGLPTYILEFDVSGAQIGARTITRSEFANVRVEVIRGYVNVRSTPIYDGTYYYTKTLSSDTITFPIGQEMVDEEYIKITTIPQ